MPKRPLTPAQTAAETARLGSFAAVAKARGTDPSTIPRKLAALEAGLGVRLFQRTTRSLSLTEAGGLYLARALPLIEELARVAGEAREMKAAPQGVLRLTASVTFGQAMILPLLPAFRAAYPDIRLQCRFTDQNLARLSQPVLPARQDPRGDRLSERHLAPRARLVISGCISGGVSWQRSGSSWEASPTGPR